MLASATTPAFAGTTGSAAKVSASTPRAGVADAASITVPGQYPTIQAALDSANSGDTVVVAPGRYAENLDFHGKDVRLESTGGADVTTIAAPGGTAVTIGPAGALTGFTVTGAAASFGAGVAVSGTGTLIQGNIFDGNTEGGGGFGAAIGGNTASPTIDRNVFQHNSCDSQFLSGVVAFVNTSSPRITNNIFEHNPCRAIDLSLPEGTAPSVINNTIVDNDGGIYVDARVPTTAHTYRNNLVVGNIVGWEVAFLNAGNAPTWDHNDLFGNTTNVVGIADPTGTAGNISADPAFADATTDDYHLTPASPAVDAGSSVDAPAVDFDGTPRPSGAAADLGAYELATVAPLAVSIDIRPGSPVNQIRRHSAGSVPVALLSTPTFDAPTIADRGTLAFGRTGTENSLRRCDRSGRDVNRDHRPDLVCWFSIRSTGFMLGDTVGVLTGKTTSGQPFSGTDAVRVR